MIGLVGQPRTHGSPTPASAHDLAQFDELWLTHTHEPLLEIGIVHIEITTKHKDERVHLSKSLSRRYTVWLT